jgi:outer membrane protein
MRHALLRRLAIVALAAALPAAAAATLDLTLERAVRRALAENRTLATSALATESERHALVAAGAEFETKVVPTTTVGRTVDSALSSEPLGYNSSVGLELQRKLEWGTLVGIGPSYNRGGGISNTTLNVSLQQPLLAGFGRDANLEGVRQAQFAVASAERQQEQAGIDIVLAVVSTYHEAVRQQRIVELNEDFEQRLRRHAAVAARKERVGLATPMDTLRAEIRRRDAEDAAHVARTMGEAALGRLRVMLAIPIDTELRLAPPSPAPSLERGDLDERALAGRMDVRQMDAELAEARRAVAVAERATLPEVTLRVNYGHATFSDPLLASLVPATQRQWSVFVQGSGDVRRTVERERYGRALLRVTALETALAEKTDDIRRLIRQQERAIEESAARIALRGEQIHHAEGKLALAELKFAHDMADNFDLIEAETDLQHARTDLITAEADHAVALHSLRAATGRLPL